MKKKVCSFQRLNGLLALLAGLAFAGCTSASNSAPAPIPTNALQIQVTGGAFTDPVVTAGTVVVLASDSTSQASRGTTGTMTKGSATYVGSLLPTAFGTLRFQAFVKDSSGNTVYYGEVTKVITTTSALLVSITPVAKVTLSPVNLEADTSALTPGSAGYYVILAKTQVSSVPASVITGNVAVSPAAATYLTGFSLTAPTTFSTSAQVTGDVYASTYAAPTPSYLITAVSNMLTAYADAAGRLNPDATELGAGDISGMTLAPGLYKWGTAVSINSDLTLNGGPSDVWIFQIAQGLTIANGKKMLLTGGALPKNIFWQSAGVVTVGTTAHLEGVFLSQTAIVLNTGATANARLLAQTAVTLDHATVTQPAP